jgi:hypothetical protein
LSNKIVSSKNASAIFLATVLVLGTIATISPSFMVGAQAQEYYGADNNYKKSYGKDVTVKSVKCNNINVNVNGLELNVLPPVLSGLLTSETQASDKGERGASSYGSGRGGSYDSGHSVSDGDFKFVCINNNNNTVIGGEEPPIPREPTIPPEPPEPPTACELCFANANVVDAIEATLELPGGISFEGIVDAEDIGFEVLTIEDFCEYIEEQNFGDFTLLLILRELVGGTEESLQAIIDCLILAGVIIND